VRRPASVLSILGDTEHFGEVIEWIRRRGLPVEIAMTGEDGLRIHRDKGADLVLVGLPLPDLAGASLIAELRERDARMPILVVGRDADVTSQLVARELGAHEYVAHPIENRKDLLFALGVTLGVRRTDAQLRELRSREAVDADLRNIVAGCAPMKAVMQRVREVCDRTLAGAAPTVLLAGEIGTGKRVIAKAIHYNGARRNRPFGEVNCTALPPDELRAQLFGGSGTGRLGLVETADGGTIFLDEIGGASLDLQRDILMAIEDRVVARPNEEAARIDVQFVAASRRDLESMSRRGEMRSDLYHRLNVLPIALPPLRERGDDIVALAELTLARLAIEHGLRAPALADDAKAALVRHPWPGNLRELRNELERLVLLVDEDVIRADHLTLKKQATIAVEIGGDLDVTIAGDRCPLEPLEREIIRQALARSGGNVSRAARFLAITRQTMLYRMKKYDFASTASGDTADDKPT
jgi:two-component system response regulator AtoC